MSDGFDDDDLIAGIGLAVTSIDERLAGVEAVLTGTGGGRRPRRRPGRPGKADAPPVLRRARPRQGDAAGITWTKWAFDTLGPGQRVDALHEIRTFVDWLNEAYALPLSTWAVPPCWYRHPGAVRELWALVASHRSAYTTTEAARATDPFEAPTSWHDRALWPCLRRLRNELGLRECAATEHQPLIQQFIITDKGFEEYVGDLTKTGRDS